MDTHIEVVVIPVSEVDRAKAFYSMLGWRLDADISGGRVPTRAVHPARLGVLDPVQPGRRADWQNHRAINVH
jgi:catechol 2,3-dioxygenase-like lactoylglutathione lyase family enzyme